MNTTSYSDTDAMRQALTPIINLIDSTRGKEGLAAIAQESRALPTIEERYKYLTEPWKAPKGFSTVLNGKPRVVVWVALCGLRDMSVVRQKLVTSDWDHKSRLSYDVNFYHDLVSAGVMSDRQIFEDLMPCLWGAVSEARGEGDEGGTRWYAEKILSEHIPSSNLFTRTRERSRVVVWPQIRPLLAVGGIGESIGIRPVR